MIEALAVLVIFLAWIVRGIMGAVGRKSQPEEPLPPPPEARQGQAQPRSARELLRELGLDLDEDDDEEDEPAPARKPVPAQQPLAPTRQAPPAWRPAATPAAPMVKGATAFSTAPPAIPLPPPWMSGELASREVGIGASRPAIAESTAPVLEVQRPNLLRGRVLADLRGGAPSLARAVLLSEVLAPPPGLRPPGELSSGGTAPRG